MQKKGGVNMIKISIKLDKRRRLNNGKFPLKIKIARKNSAFKSGKTKCARFEKRNVQKSGKTKRPKKIAHTTL